MSEWVHVPAECDCCKTWEPMLKKADEDLKAAERDLRGKRSQIAKLKADPARFKDHPDLHLAEEVFAYYRKRFNKTKKFAFDVKRQQVILEALVHFTVRELKMAIEGAYTDPWVGKGGVEINELASIFKHAPAIDSFMAHYRRRQGQAVDVLPPTSVRQRLALQEAAQRPSETVVVQAPAWPPNFDKLIDYIWRETRDPRGRRKDDDMEPRQVFDVDQLVSVLQAEKIHREDGSFHWIARCPACNRDRQLIVFSAGTITSLCGCDWGWITRAAVLRHCKALMWTIEEYLQTIDIHRKEDDAGPERAGRNGDAGAMRVVQDQHGEASAASA